MIHRERTHLPPLSSPPHTLLSVFVQHSRGVPSLRAGNILLYDVPPKVSQKDLTSLVMPTPKFIHLRKYILTSCDVLSNMLETRHKGANKINVILMVYDSIGNKLSINIICPNELNDAKEQAVTEPGGGFYAHSLGGLLSTPHHFWLFLPTACRTSAMRVARVVNTASPHSILSIGSVTLSTIMYIKTSFTVS